MTASVWLEDLPHDELTWPRRVDGLGGRPHALLGSVAASDPEAPRALGAEALADLLVQRASAAVRALGRAGIPPAVQVDCPQALLMAPGGAVELARRVASACAAGETLIGLPADARGTADARRLLRSGIGVGLGPVSTEATWVACLDALAAGLEARRADGRPLAGIACVLWIPSGLIDAQCARWLPRESPLRGAIGTAIAQAFYLRAFRDLAQARWQVLREAGARPPRVGFNHLGRSDSVSLRELALPGAVVAVPPDWAPAVRDADLAGAEADETVARWICRELEGRGVPLADVLVQAELTAARRAAGAERRATALLAAC